jgi:hypothetical protein
MCCYVFQNFTIGHVHRTPSSCICSCRTRISKKCHSQSAPKQLEQLCTRQWAHCIRRSGYCSRGSRVAASHAHVQHHRACCSAALLPGAACSASCASCSNHLHIFVLRTSRRTSLWQKQRASMIVALKSCLLKTPIAHMPLLLLPARSLTMKWPQSLQTCHCWCLLSAIPCLMNHIIELSVIC